MISENNPNYPIRNAQLDAMIVVKPMAYHDIVNYCS